MGQNGLSCGLGDIAVPRSCSVSIICGPSTLSMKAVRPSMAFWSCFSDISLLSGSVSLNGTLRVT